LVNYRGPQAVWYDVDGDGLSDIVAARVIVPSLPFEKKRGELVWLKQPASDPLTQHWVETSLIGPKGPDVYFEIINLDGKGLPEVVATQYFDQQATVLYWCDEDTWDKCAG